MGGRERGREGWREGWREGGVDGGREGGRKGSAFLTVTFTPIDIFLSQTIPAISLMTFPIQLPPHYLTLSCLFTTLE